MGRTFIACSNSIWNVSDRLTPSLAASRSISSDVHRQPECDYWVTPSCWPTASLFFGVTIIAKGSKIGYRQIQSRKRYAFQSGNHGPLRYGAGRAASHISRGADRALAAVAGRA